MKGTPESRLVADEVWVSVILLNYNGSAWMTRCLETLQGQSIFNRMQIIIADNQSNDGSDHQAQDFTASWTNTLFIQNGCNLGFGGGVNLVTKHATGRYLFLLNPDVWLEPRCIEELYLAAEKANVGCAGVLVLDYENDEIQSRGGIGFDLSGHGVEPPRGYVPTTLFMGHGFAFLRKDLFERIGGYDDLYFLYGEELDLCWRIWASGDKIVHAPMARIHHRGAVSVNPKGGSKVVEIRTNDSKRFYSNRNHLLSLLKNSQHLLLLLIVPSLLLYFVESVAGTILVGRWSFFERTFWQPVRECWRLRTHIQAKRKSLRGFRKRGDLWMLRFLTWRFARWEDYRRFFRLGLPRIDAR